MNEIPEWAIKDAEKSLKGIYPEMVSPQAFLYLRETIARALVAQMERDIQAVADLKNPFRDQFIIDGWKTGNSEAQRAIRDAAEATRPGEGSGG